MKRSHFIATFLGMLGIAKGQERTITALPAYSGCYDYKHNRVECLAWPDGKAKNNQCPVCGTMAESYKRESSGDEFAYIIGADGALHVNKLFPETTQVKWRGLKEREIRCKRCNAAFWQDAE